MLSGVYGHHFIMTVRNGILFWGSTLYHILAYYNIINIMECENYEQFRSTLLRIFELGFGFPESEDLSK